MKGKPWTVEDEKKLAKLVKDKKTLGVIAETLGKSPEAVRKKIERLKLEVVDQALQQRTTTTSPLVLPKELPSVEESIIDLFRCLNDFDDSITRYQVNWFFTNKVEKDEVRHYSCRTIRRYGWCLGGECPRL
jgi:hypothetical protein